jgi:hypothetical protein
MNSSTEETKMRYKRIAKAVVEGSPLKKVIKEQGYSDTIAESPTKLTKKKSFQELLNEIMPEEFVLDQHKRLYSEHRDIKQIRLESLEDEDIKQACDGYENVSVVKKTEEGYTLLIINQVDRQARKDAVELAHRLRGSFSPTKIEIKREYEDIPDEQLLALLKDKQEEE